MFDNLTTAQMYWLFGIIAVLLTMTVISLLAVYKRHHREPVTLMLWAQISIIPFFGPLAYLFIGRKHGEKK